MIRHSSSMASMLSFPCYSTFLEAAFGSSARPIFLLIICLCLFSVIPPVTWLLTFLERKRRSVKKLAVITMFGKKILLVNLSPALLSLLTIWLVGMTHFFFARHMPLPVQRYTKTCQLVVDLFGKERKWSIKFMQPLTKWFWSPTCHQPFILSHHLPSPQLVLEGGADCSGRPDNVSAEISVI